MLMLGGLIALFAPVEGISCIDLFGTFVLNIDSFAKVQEAYLAN